MFLRERRPGSDPWPLKPRRGSVAVTTAVMMVVLLGITAIALDGGSLLAERRHAQGTADAAALAAAGELYKNWNTAKGVDNGGASVAAFAVAAANGYKNDANPDLGMANDYRTSSVVVNIPPKTGLFTGQPGYAEVMVTYYAPRFFSNIFGKGSLPIFARTVARGMQTTSKFGMLILDPKSSGSLTAGGNGGLTETGGAIMVNSNSSSAVNCNGNGTITAQALDLTGGYSGGSSQIITSDGIKTGVDPTPDPFRSWPEPKQANYSVGKCTYDKTTQTYTLTPGVYGNLPNFTNGDTVVFQQASAGNDGIFYLTNGFNANGATITMDTTNTNGGLMIYNAGTGGNDGISITGNPNPPPNGGITLAGLERGPWVGMVIFQAREATEPLSITGNGNVNITGNIYAAGATLKMAGNGTGNNIGSQYVTQDLVITGNGDLTVKDNQNTNPPLRMLQIVE